VLKGKIFQLRIVYLAKLSLIVEEKIKSFPGKQKLKIFITTKRVLQEMLEGLDEAKKKGTNK